MRRIRRLRWRVAAALAAGLAASAALAQSGGDPLPPITHEGFLRSPSQEAIAAIYPAEALRRGPDGQVVLRCRLTAIGGLSACTVESETPPGVGFGAAALALTAQFQVRPGQARAGEWIRAPINFVTTGRGVAGRDQMLIRPPWGEAPTRAEVIAASPEQAGLATLRCRVAGDGRLRLCNVVRENPRHAGLRSPALSLSGRFRLQPPPGAPMPEGAYVDIPVALSRAPPDLLDHPPFASGPSAEAIAQALGDLAGAASDHRVRVSADCRVGADAALTDCRPVSGSAEAQAAAAPLFAQFVARRWTDDGRATVGARVTVALTYAVE